MSLLAGRTVLAVDTETTGYSPADGHRLIEVARVRSWTARSARSGPRS